VVINRSAGVLARSSRAIRDWAAAMLDGTPPRNESSPAVHPVKRLGFAGHVRVSQLRLVRAAVPGHDPFAARARERQSLPLIEIALEQLRDERVIAPGTTSVEHLVWRVQRLAERRVERSLTQPLTEQHLWLLDGVLHVDPELRGRTRLSWLRDAPEIASARSLRKVLDRLMYAQKLAVPRSSEVRSVPWLRSVNTPISMASCDLGLRRRIGRSDGKADADHSRPLELEVERDLAAGH
jgi:hypothetical protein